jgi:hypothetical protein
MRRRWRRALLAPGRALATMNVSSQTRNPAHSADARHCVRRLAPPDAWGRSPGGPTPGHALELRARRSCRYEAIPIWRPPCGLAGRGSSRLAHPSESQPSPAVGSRGHSKPAPWYSPRTMATRCDCSKVSRSRRDPSGAALASCRADAFAPRRCTSAVLPRSPQRNGFRNTRSAKWVMDSPLRDSRQAPAHSQLLVIAPIAGREGAERHLQQANAWEGDRPCARPKTQGGAVGRTVGGIGKCGSDNCLSRRVWLWL